QGRRRRRREQRLRQLQELQRRDAGAGSSPRPRWAPPSVQREQQRLRRRLVGVASRPRQPWGPDPGGERVTEGCSRRRPEGRGRWRSQRPRASPPRPGARQQLRGWHRHPGGDQPQGEQRAKVHGPGGAPGSQELCPHIRDEIDFFYCPWDDSSGMNRGYVFMNFMDFQRANAFQYTWANKEIRQGDAMTRIRIQKAKPQGLVNSVKFFSDAGALNQELCHRPLVRDAGGTLKPLYAESFELPAGQGGSWLFGQPGSRGNGHAGARTRGGDAGGHGPAPGAGLCAWPTPQQGGLDYGVGAPLQPVWPVQAAGEAPDADAGGTVATAEGGQMLPGMEVAYMIMPMEYINSGYNSGYFPTMVVADPSGATRLPAAPAVAEAAGGWLGSGGTAGGCERRGVGCRVQGAPRSLLGQGSGQR
ncbi:unnamed protein product, partial [Prorocentrum cordatum]